MVANAVATAIQTYACHFLTSVYPAGEQGIVTAELDLTYKHRFSEAYIPDAYERLILCVRLGGFFYFRPFSSAIPSAATETCLKANMPILFAMTN